MATEQVNTSVKVKDLSNMDDVLEAIENGAQMGNPFAGIKQGAEIQTTLTGKGEVRSFTDSNGRKSEGIYYYLTCGGRAKALASIPLKKGHPVTVLSQRTENGFPYASFVLPKKEEKKAEKADN